MIIFVFPSQFSFFPASVAAADVCLSLFLCFSDNSNNNSNNNNSNKVGP